MCSASSSSGRRGFTGWLVSPDLLVDWLDRASSYYVLDVPAPLLVGGVAIGLLTFAAAWKWIR